MWCRVLYLQAGASPLAGLVEIWSLARGWTLVIPPVPDTIAKRNQSQ